MPARVLIVDDEPDVLTTLRMQLEPLYTVSEAADGTQAWEAICNQPPDAIVTDLRMPGINGLDLIERIKAHDRYKHIPLIILTGVTRGEELHGNFWKMATDADLFLEKPALAETLRAEIDRLLKERQNWRELPPGKGYYD